METNNGASRISRRFARRHDSRFSKIFDFVKVTVTIKKRIQRLIVAILTMSLLLTGFTFMPVASQIANPDSDNGVAYAAAKKVKVTFNANGGNFTAKKYAKKKSYSKKITKGKKIGTLPKIKKSGYTFKGWYTKKSGGKKITKNTKVKKNTSFYAQWKKNKSSTTGNSKRNLTAEEKKLVGGWVSGTSWNGYWTTIDQFSQRYNEGGTVIMGRQFNADGTYANFTVTGSTWLYMTGNWSVSNGQIHYTNQMTWQQGKNEPFAESDNSKYYKFETRSEGYGMVIDDYADFSGFWASYFFVKGK